MFNPGASSSLMFSTNSREPSSSAFTITSSAPPNPFLAAELFPLSALKGSGEQQGAVCETGPSSLMRKSPIIHVSTTAAAASCSSSNQAHGFSIEPKGNSPSSSTRNSGGVAIVEENGSHTTVVKEDEVSSSGATEEPNNYYKFLENLHVGSLVNESIYEAAAKLLFLSVKWARSVPSFLSVSCYC